MLFSHLTSLQYGCGNQTTYVCYKLYGFLPYGSFIFNTMILLTRNAHGESIQMVHVVYIMFYLGLRSGTK